MDNQPIIKIAGAASRGKSEVGRPRVARRVTVQMKCQTYASTVEPAVVSDKSTTNTTAGGGTQSTASLWRRAISVGVGTHSSSESGR